MRALTRPRRSRGRWPVLAAVLLLILVLAACADESDPLAGDADPATSAPATVTVTESQGVETTVAEPATTTTDAEAPSATLWFMSEEGVLVGETRAGAGGSVRNALTALAEGPSDPTLIPAFTAGSGVVGTDLEGDVVVVEVDQAFEDGYPAGGAAELATVAPIVYTATELAGVSAVRLEVAGEPLAPVAAQLDLAAPIARADVETETVAPEVEP